MGYILNRYTICTFEVLLLRKHEYLFGLKFGQIADDFVLLFDFTGYNRKTVTVFTFTWFEKTTPVKVFLNYLRSTTIISLNFKSQKDFCTLSQSFAVEVVASKPSSTFPAELLALIPGYEFSSFSSTLKHITVSLFLQSFLNSL